MTSNYKIRKKGFPQGYPQPGTKLARVLECLEAESATLDEIAEYLGEETTPKIAGALAISLISENLVERVGIGKYQLKDPELVSLVYGSLETFG